MSNRPTVHDAVNSVKLFLETNHALSSHIPVIEDKISSYFGESVVYQYEIHEDPEIEMTQLLIEIISPHSPEESLNRLRRFDREWWIAYSEQFNHMIVITVGF